VRGHIDINQKPITYGTDILELVSDKTDKEAYKEKRRIELDPTGSGKWSVSCDSCDSNRAPNSVPDTSLLVIENEPRLRLGGYSLYHLTNCVFCEQPFVPIEVKDPRINGYPSYDYRGFILDDFKMSMQNRSSSKSHLGPSRDEWGTMLELNDKRVEEYNSDLPIRY